MNVTFDQGQKPAVVTIHEARLDAAISTRFKDRMREVIGVMKCDAVLDMSEVDFMDSSGLGALIAIHKSMPDGFRLILRGPRPNVLRVFRLTRMDTVFHIEDQPERGAA